MKPWYTKLYDEIEQNKNSICTDRKTKRIIILFIFHLWTDRKTKKQNFILLLCIFAINKNRQKSTSKNFRCSVLFSILSMPHVLCLFSWYCWNCVDKKCFAISCICENWKYKRGIFWYVNYQAYSFNFRFHYSKIFIIASKPLKFIWTNQLLEWTWSACKWYALCDNMKIEIKQQFNVEKMHFSFMQNDYKLT